MARLAISIDGAYLDKLCELEFDRASIDFAKLPLAITDIINGQSPEAVDLLRTLYYHCPPYQSNPPTQDERDRTSRFRRWITALGYLDRFDFREGRLQLRGFDKDTGEPIFQQKRVDLMLGLDFALLSGKRQVAHIALVAGDSDLIPAMQVAKQEGVSVWLFHGPRSSKQDGRPTFSQDLWREVDMRFEIDQSFINQVKR